MRRLLVLALGGVLALGACGSSGSGSGATSTTTTKSALNAADRRVGRAALLRAADAPGYQEVSPQQSLLADLTTAASSVKACAPYLTGKQPRLGTGRAKRPPARHHRRRLEQRGVRRRRDRAGGARALRAPWMAKCLQTVYRPQDTPVTAAPLTMAELGDDRVAYRLTPTGQPDATAGVDVLVIRVGRVLMSATITGTTADADELQRGAITQAVDRVRAAEA